MSRRMIEVAMRTYFITFVYLLLLLSTTAYGENKLTGAYLLLYDIKNNREAIVELYRKNFEDGFNKLDSDYSDDFKSLLAECSAELIVQELEVMSAEELRIYHSNPEIHKAGSDRVITKCYGWIETELETLKTGKDKQ